MVTRAHRKDVDRTQAEKYRRVGAALLEGAKALADLALDGDSYGNAIAVISVHACIAYNDALSIAWRGVKSTEGDHVRAADTLVFALGHLALTEQVRRLRTILSHKDQVAYQGSYYRVNEAARLLEQAAAFCAWAEAMYDRRPPR
jgi:hypothetical protein